MLPALRGCCSMAAECTRQHTLRQPVLGVVICEPSEQRTRMSWQSLSWKSKATAEVCLCATSCTGTQATRMRSNRNSSSSWKATHARSQVQSAQSPLSEQDSPIRTRVLGAASSTQHSSHQTARRGAVARALCVLPERGYSSTVQPVSLVTPAASAPPSLPTLQARARRREEAGKPAQSESSQKPRCSCGYLAAILAAVSATSHHNLWYGRTTPVALLKLRETTNN